ATVREFCELTTLLLNWSTLAQLRPPGVRSSGKRSAMRYEPFGFGGTETESAFVPGSAVIALSIAWSGVIGFASLLDTDGAALGTFCVPAILCSDCSMSSSK